MRRDRFAGAGEGVVHVRLREAGRRIECWTVREDERGDETVGPSCYLSPEEATALAFELSSWATAHRNIRDDHTIGSVRPTRRRS